jgi:hypothetical protein
MTDYRAAPPTNHASRPPLSSSRWHRTISTERDDRATRSSSLQRPSNYLPAFDRI